MFDRLAAVDPLKIAVFGLLAVFVALGAAFGHKAASLDEEYGLAPLVTIEKGATPGTVSFVDE